MTAIHFVVRHFTPNNIRSVKRLIRRTTLSVKLQRFRRETHGVGESQREIRGHLQDSSKHSSTVFLTAVTSFPETINNRYASSNTLCEAMIDDYSNVYVGLTCPTHSEQTPVRWISRVKRTLQRYISWSERSRR